MAEQEVCTALVDEATSGEEPATPATPPAHSGPIDGESQLLPLLQGLLVAPPNDVTPDSGTESGEDQRSGLIAEVQNALEKLSASLKSDQTDITPERRSSLLQLVSKLQAGLSGGGAAGDRRSSTATTAGGRFQKRRNRQTRHTVGVSKEELADARRLIEEISLNELTPPRLSKQNSESSVPTSSPSSSYKNVTQAKKVKNATAKPFSSSNSSSSIHTPTELVEAFDLLFGEDVSYHQAPPVKTSSGSSTTSAHKATKKTEPCSDDADDSGTLGFENALKKNPIYAKPSEEASTRAQRFDVHGRKLKMKRANTIDIPKPLLYYEDDDDDESEEEPQDKRDGGYALKGPLGVSDPSGKKMVPAFEPKTESDKKFLAFISKHDDQKTDKSSPWGGGTTWGSRFGNLKSNFERKEAKSFWKSADDGDAHKPSQFGPRISRRSARNLQEMFAEKQKENSIVTGSLTVRSEPRQINQFSHAPQSAFKPLPKKTVPDGDRIFKSEIKRDDGSVFLYSPKPLVPSSSSAGSPCSSATSPTVVKPWTSTAGGSRVLSLAAAKFEQQARPEPPRPQKLVGKIAVPSALREPSKSPEKAYHARNSETKSDTVRKLSGQFDGYRPQTYQISANVTQKQYAPTARPRYDLPQSYGRQNSSPSNYVPQNYTIRYDRTEPNQPVSYGQPQQQRVYQHVPGQQVAKPLTQYNQPTVQTYGYTDQSRTDSLNQHRSAQQYNQPPIQTYNYTAQRRTASQNHHQNGQQFPTPSTQYNQPPVQTYDYTAQSNTDSQNQQQLGKQVANSSTSRHSSTKLNQPPIQTYNYTAQGPSAHSHPMADQDAQFTSTFVFKPQKAVEPVVQPKLQTQISNESVHEHTAVSSKVMTGPVSQQATFVKQKSPMSRDQHDLEAAFNLKNTLQNVKSNSSTRSPSNSFKYKGEVQKFKSEDTKSCGVVKPIVQPQKPLEKLQIDDRGQSVVTGHFHIPLINVKSPESPRAPTQAQILSKSDSWHQICLAQQGAASKTPPKTAATVVRSKSSHTLAVPKMFEAGMSKEEMLEKRRAMESFLGGGKSPPGTTKVVKRSVNRVKTAEKVSVSSRGISRSRTLPDIVCPDLLDESKVDESFEELFKTS